MFRVNSRWRTTAALLGLACGGGAQSRAPNATDAGPQRIVSLSPAITEVLFALGVGERLVGRTRWDADPPAALAVPSVGDGLNPNIEAIVARRPDVVVFYQSAANTEAMQRLASLGIATVSVQLDRIADLRLAARQLGALVGYSQRADSLVTALDRRLAATSAPSGGPHVLLLAWDNPPIVIGGGSFLDEIVTLAGGANVFADEEAPSLSVNIETIARRNPDLVVVTGSDTTFATRPEWQSVPAIRDRRFVFVRGTEFSYPSFRVDEAIVQLRKALDGRRP